MAEAVHEVAHEATHEAAHSGNSRAKAIGLLISVLALFLAVSEMAGKSAQTHGLALTVEASDTWSFFQAKTMRQTVLRTALENAKVAQSGDNPDRDKQLAAWQATVDRWESEPSTNEGRKELSKRARDIETRRNAALGQYHAYEIASLTLQLGIVLASVALLSSIGAFALGSMALGAVGLLLLAGTYFDWHFITGLLH
jgi:hypothetical protein